MSDTFLSWRTKVWLSECLIDNGKNKTTYIDLNVILHLELYIHKTKYEKYYPTDNAK